MPLRSTSYYFALMRPGTRASQRAARRDDITPGMKSTARLIVGQMDADSVVRAGTTANSMNQATSLSGFRQRTILGLAYRRFGQARRGGGRLGSYDDDDDSAAFIATVRLFEKQTIDGPRVIPPTPCCISRYSPSRRKIHPDE